MKTYKFKLFYVAVVLTMIFQACNDSFMDRFPETSITEQVFFSSPKDLETYTNSFYGYIGCDFWDIGTDNVMYVDIHEIYNMMTNTVNEQNVGSWSGHWNRIYNVNFMLARSHQAQGDQAEINHYVGIAKFFRAHLFYNLVKLYSDVPWYSRDLNNTDLDLLYKKQDPRSLVVDSIMADLQYAVDNIRVDAGKTRITKYAALALQARIALYEGTFRKYHPELELSDADRFLEIAANAAYQLIDSKAFSLHPNYMAIFNSVDLSANSEIIMYDAYDKGLRLHSSSSVFDWTSGLSRDLMEDYLIIVNNQAIPFQQIPGYDEKTLLEIFQDNRDPRMFQTFMVPGYISPRDATAHRTGMARGGYSQYKFWPDAQEDIPGQFCYTDLPIFRFGEALLIYAEARAELSKLTNDDMDLTINKRRERANMPSASLSDWLANIDPVQANRYQNVTSAQKGAILEIRRERRIELACEGFRFGDLMRWSAGKLLEKAPEGCYISGFGYQDITGDGVPDIAIVQTQADADAIPAEDRAQLTVYILDNETFELTQGNKGYIVQKSQVNRYTFVEPKYYYYPLSQQDMLVNPNLEQNRFWK